ncbi:MAG TPA: small acid-soluble spore protein SspI [Pseudogracilibacillus sp.]|nr:small acid-soluble spore protein SspI [Pseudogracilibacillus sp.]
MDINLREAIIKNVVDSSSDELEATVEDAIQDAEEQTLPGLGVIFEIIWKNSDEAGKVEMIHALEEGLNQMK